MESSTMKFFLIDEDLLNTLVEMMYDSIEQSSDVKDNDNVMFFTWLYDELLELPQIKDAKKFALYNKKKILSNKSKDTLTDAEIKMLNYLNAIIKASSNRSDLTSEQKKARKIINEEASKIKKDIKGVKDEKGIVDAYKKVSKRMSLKEIKQYLMEDPELTNWERFELYYEERGQRRLERKDKKEKREAVSYDEMMKNLGIKPSDYNPDDDKN